MVEGTDHLRGVGLTLLGVVVLSPDALLVRLVSADPWTLLFWRGLLVGVALTLYIAARDRGQAARIARAMGRPGLAASVLYAVSTTLFVTAVKLTTIANTLFILSAMPLFAAIIERVVFGVLVPRRTWLAIAIVLGGMAIIFAGSLERGDMLGNLAAITAASGWGALLVLLRHGRFADPLPVMASGGLVVAAAALAVAPTVLVGREDAVFLAILGLVVLPVAYGLISHGPRYLPAPEVSLIVLLEAILGPLWAWAVLAEVPPHPTFVGGAVILATLAIHFTLSLRQAPAAPA